MDGFFVSLFSMDKLEPGWGDGDAPAIDPKLIETVRKFVGDYKGWPFLPECNPLLDGAIRVTWEFDHNESIVDVEFETDCHRFYVLPSNVKSYWDDIRADGAIDRLAKTVWAVSGLSEGNAEKQG